MAMAGALRGEQVAVLGLGCKMLWASTVVAVIIERASMTLRRPDTDQESPTAPSSCDSSTVANVREQGFYLIKEVQVSLQLPSSLLALCIASLSLESHHAFW